MGTVVHEPVGGHSERAGRHRPLRRDVSFIRPPLTAAQYARHLIVDYYGTHQHPKGSTWLKPHPRTRLHFTATTRSWRNLVERWFRDLTDKRIRRDSFDSVPDLTATIENYIMKSNQSPHIFVWTASVEKSLAKLAKCKEALDALHQRGARGGG